MGRQYRNENILSLEHVLAACKFIMLDREKSQNCGLNLEKSPFHWLQQAAIPALA
jgi:hypothetical protein